MKRRNKFNLSRTANLSCSPGELVPLGKPIEVLPGDSHQMATSMLLRVLPLLAPVMHPFDIKIHSWFVPHRIVWPEFEEFITGGPDNDSDIVAPYMEAPFAGYNVGTLADYMGFPTGQLNNPADSRRHSALPFRGYAKIYNEFYRDQDLQTELPISTASGADTTTSTTLMFANWQKDYFTSARPWEAKGPTVMLPLSGDAPIKSNAGVAETLGIRNSANQLMAVGTSPPTVAFMTGTPVADVNDALKADLSGVSAATILQLRLAMALQRYAENRARYGSRYPEYLLALGVRPDDARLDRPEYLGGGQQTITFSEVLQTAPNTSGTPSPGVGNMRGHGIAALRSNRFRKFFSEHGYIHTFVVVRPRTVYSQGLPRTYSRFTKEDYWQPELEHIGQQEILNKEIMWADTTTGNAVWGWQDRYDDYRREESTIHGEFRTTLNYWHAAREFTVRPALNAAFVLSNPTNRIYSVTDPAVDKMYLQVRHSHQARRLLSRVGSSFTY